ncbi:MAG: hypothetical protein A2Z97_05850 [Bdellovibrionales bacterium GWB1_52_6]|nr:MAG: hypothetical protein A2Z97_05850 [Bdellovibrionales bacterium GWB1_52_6]OFZ04398.1 MAG: hypothetical protein A2X97_07065 [Bdellovibrionales bacterium GWA1_52_35]HCM40746.1 hypothetical protein [Bdellovibrionales bacterium]
MGVRFLRSSFSLSLILHAFLVFACGILTLQRPALNPSSRKIWVELEHRRVSPATPASRPLDQNRVRQQIVQTERGKEVKTAAKDAFLGERTQIVDEQTVNREKMIAMGKASREKTAKPKIKSEEPEKALSNFGVAVPAALSQRTELLRDDGAEARWNTGGNPQDYVKGFAEASRTALNTKEYVFYGYFQRIRERLDRAWVPILRTKLTKFYRTGRQLASDMDHTTKVVVTLNPKGEITRVSIVGESGVHDLDDAAINAFNKAGPFPNPPRGIVDRNGEIQIPWEFILKT